MTNKWFGTKLFVSGWRLQTLLKCPPSHNNFKDFVSILICAWQLLKRSRTILNGYFQQVSFILLKNSVESTSFIVFSSWFYHFPFLFFILRIARFTKEEFTIKPVRLAHTLRSHHRVPPKDPGSRVPLFRYAMIKRISSVWLIFLNAQLDSHLNSHK